MTPLMPRLRAVLIALLLTAGPSTADASIDFYFTNDAVLRHGGTAGVLAEWTTQCVSGGEFAEVAAPSAPSAQMRMQERRTQAAKFDRDAFVRIATGAWQKANAALPQGSVRVCVDLVPTADAFTRDTMGGIAAVTAGKGRIILRIHPDADWRAAVPYALAHEMHHSYWAEHHFDPARPFTLRDYMVLEGRADYFARTMFSHPAPWTAALEGAAYTAAWRTLLRQLDSTDWGALTAAMFGAPQAGIPAWAGYRIGYRFVSERMSRAPRLDVRAMTAAPATEFIPREAGK